MALSIVHDFAESFLFLLICISLHQKSCSERLLSLLGVPIRLASFSGRFFMFESSTFFKKGSATSIQGLEFSGRARSITV